jgi:CubicO group peptidase (beta-lactamase class C family)
MTATREELGEVFLAHCTARGKADYVFVCRFNPETCEFDTMCDSETLGPEYDLLGGVQANIFSCTKSLTGLCIALDYLCNDIPIKTPLHEMLRDMDSFTTAGFHEYGYKSIINYLNHVTGIQTGATRRDKDGIGELWNTMATGDVVDAYTALRRGVWRDSLTPDDAPKPFAYNNYGIQIAGILYEIYVRRARDRLDPANPFTVRETVCDILYGAGNHGDEIVWPLKNARTPHAHSACFSGVQITGRQMVELGQLLYDRFRPVLLFISGDAPYCDHHGHLVTNDNVVVARDLNVDPGFHSESVYTYSFGWWMQTVGAHRYISMQGMCGQRITINLHTGLVAVRKTNEDSMRLLKRFASGENINDHPSFTRALGAYEQALRTRDIAALRVALDADLP